MLAGDRLFVLVGGSEGINLVAFDPATGKTLLAVGQARKGSYATPVLGILGGVHQMVVAAGDIIYGVRPDSNDILWSHEGLSYPDRDPLLLPGGRVFLAFQEYAAMLELAGQPLQARELWRSERLSFSYSLAVYHEGAIYAYGAERLTCLDASSGSIVWEQGVGDGALIRIDDHVVAYGTMTGKLHLVEASRDGFVEVASRLVFPSGGSVTPPSFAAGRIFLRGRKQIAAVRLVSIPPNEPRGKLL